MPKPETNRAKIVDRLVGEGWENQGGGGHDKYTHRDFSRPAIVPRHRTLSPGVARDIARAAGWSAKPTVSPNARGKEDDA